ncbi:hypothetical protein RBB50_011228 [Rhinocladiella similis]
MTGPIVRYGPDKLLFNEPKAWQDIYAYKANVRKSDTFSASQSHPDSTDTFSELYKEPALKKRKTLSYGFSESSLRSFEAYMLDQINLFCHQLVSPSTEKVKDMSLWFNYLSYDIMGEMVFGRGFSMLTDPSLRYMLDLIDSTVFSYLLGSIIPWLHKSGIITLLMPRIFFGRKKFFAEAGKRITERIQLGPDAEEVNGRRDFFHWLLNGKDENGQPLQHARLGAEGILLILAGSDTSSASLAGTLFYLMQQPRCQKKLLEELERTFDDVDDIRLGDKLTSCVYLRACVDEALRMASAGPGVSERTILKGGTMIDGVYFPEGTTVGSGGWASSYNEKYIRDCDKYWPERHIPSEEFSAEEVQLAHSAYWPFGLGARKCVGMKVALNELHLTTARLIYLLEPIPEKPQEFEKNFEILDHQNPKKVGPWASFRLRPGRELPDLKPTQMQGITD